MSIGAFFGGSAQQLIMLQQQAAFNAYNQQLLANLQQQATQEFQNGLGQSPTTLYGRPITPANLANIRTAYISYLLAGQRAWESKQSRASTIPSEGIRAGEIIAYRVWDIEPPDILRSITATNEWPAGEPMQATDGDVVRGLGIHCFKGIGSARGVANGLDSHMTVVGSIEIWGEIVEHDMGYRAQYAAIRSLDYIVNAPWIFWRGMRKRRLLNRIREKYGLT